MDERKTTGLTESTVEQPVQGDGRTMLEQAFARGSGHLSDVPSVAPERTEHSVMEGLPPAKAERIAAMRRELAELQRQLSEAQQRIATELQGRAEDAERIEALEARLQAQEVKAQEDATRTAELVTEIASLRSQLSTVTATAEELRRDVTSRDAQIEEVRRQHRDVTEQLEARSSSLNEAKKLLETRDGALATTTAELATRTAELTTRTAERDNEQATKSRLERELEDQRQQHRDLTTQLESQVASLRDANALIATRDAELIAITSERDAIKGELAAARAKARDVATQLARVGQDLMEGVGDAPTGSSSEPPSATTSRSTERPKPPPVPAPRAAAPTEPQVETILEVTEEPKSSSRIGAVLISGVILGCLATIAFVKWRSSSSIAAADERQDLGASPSATLAPERASPSVMADQAGAVRGTSSTQPTPSSDTVSDRPNVWGDSHPVAPAEITKNGVIVLPQEAADHRVFVDDRVVPVKNSRAVVPCGTREIRIGSSGTSRTLDVACGGETAVPGDTPER